MRTTSTHATGLVRGMRHVPRAAPERKRIDRHVLTALSLVAMMAFAATHLGWEAVKERRPKAEILPLMLAGKPLSVPAAWLRDGAARPDRDLQRLDLVVPLHSGGDQPTAALDRVVLIRLSPADEAVPPHERAGSLYARFFDSNVWTNPGGLILRGFAPGTPYEGEELYLAPPDGRDFAARCPRADSAATHAPIGAGMCIWEFRVGGLDALVAFAPGRLSDWQNVVATARETVALVTRPAPDAQSSRSESRIAIEKL